MIWFISSTDKACVIPRCKAPFRISVKRAYLKVHLTPKYICRFLFLHAPVWNALYLSFTFLLYQLFSFFTGCESYGI